jgi:glutamate synthase (NADPH/NADH) large chain
VAEELRAIMAEMGFKTVAEMVGRVDRSNMKKRDRALEGAGHRPLALLHQVPLASPSLNWTETQDHGLGGALDNDLIVAASDALIEGKAVRIERRSSTSTARSARCSQARWPSVTVMRACPTTRSISL